MYRTSSGTPNRAATSYQQTSVYAEGICSKVATALPVVDACLGGDALWRMGWQQLAADLRNPPEEQNNHHRIELEAADDHHDGEEHFGGSG